MRSTGKAARLTLCIALVVSSAWADPINQRGFPVGPPSTDAAPIDASGAVGPSHVVSLTNYWLTVQDRDGNVALRTSLADFWTGIFSSSTKLDPFDPRISWNPHRGRYVATSLLGGEELNHPQSELLVAVSKTADPTGGWQGHRYSVAADKWIDFANLGFSRRWIVVQVDLRSRNDPAQGVENKSLGTRIYVFTPADLEAAATPTPEEIELLIDPTKPEEWIGYEIPALNYDATDDLYFLQTNYGDDRGRGWLAVYRLTEDSGTAKFEPAGEVGTPLRWTGEPPSTQLVPQRGSYHFLQTDGVYVQSVTQRSGSLWAVHTVYLPVGLGARSSVQWWQIDVSSGTPKTLQTGRIDDPRAGDDSTGRLFSCPSLAVNGDGDMALGFGMHATDLYASAGFALRRGADPPGTTRGPYLLNLGEGVYEPGGRWSDYTATVVDPADDAFWTLQVVAASPEAGTGAGRVRLSWSRIEGVD